VAHDPTRHSPGGIGHHFTGIAAVAGGVGSGSLPDFAHCGGVARQSLQNARRRVGLGRKPRRLCHQLAVESRETSLDIAPLAGERDKFFSRFDCVEVCASARPVPGFSPRRRKHSVVTRRSDRDGTNPQSQLRRACPLESVGGIENVGKVGCERSYAAQIFKQPRIASSDSLPRHALVSESLGDKRPQGIGNRPGLSGELALKLAELNGRI